MEHGSEGNKLTAWLLARPVLSGILFSCILFVAVACVIGQRYFLLKENDRREMTNLLHVVRQNMDQSLQNSFTSALTLALTINDEGKPENFEKIGKQLTGSNPAIDGVQLVPGGVIKYVYPLKENAAALNLDILHDPYTMAEANEAIRLKKMYFAGPLKLRQGGIGIIGRLPVYQNDTFWGFSAVVIKLETLLNVSGITSIDATKYYFQLSKINPVTGKEDFFIPGDTDLGNSYYEAATLGDSDMKLYIVTKSGYGAYSQLLPLSLLGILYIVLFGFLITLLLRKPAELQITVNSQADKLQRSETKFRTLFEYAPIGIGRVDTETGHIIDVNSHHCKITGYSASELVGLNFGLLVHPDDLGETTDKMNALKNGLISEFSQEKLLKTKDGQYKWVNLTVSPLWKPGEKPTSHIAIIEDISSEKEAKEQISKSEARFKSLFEDSPIALWEEDFSRVKKYLSSLGLIGEKPKTVLSYFNANPEALETCIELVKIIDVNNECIKLHGLKSKEELLYGALNHILDEESIKAFTKQLIAITSNSLQISMETRVARNTEVSDIHLRWNVMRGYEDTLERVIISTEDITAQKNAERMLLKSRQEMESLIDTIDGIVWESDYESYEFTFVNKRAEVITGYPVEEWLNDATFWGKTIHPDDKDWAINFCAVNSQEKRRYDFEYRMISKNGEVLWMRDIVNVVYEGGKPLKLRGIMIDITKQKEAEKDLQDSFELVTEQNKRLHNFSFIVSHNLRSHTANIQSITNLIELADSDEERNELVQMMKTVSGTLNDTMLHLNDLLNIQSKVALVSDNLDLNHYVDNTLKILSEQISTKRVQVIQNIPSGVTVDYNPAYLDSILLNLLSNAVRYSDSSREPEITIEWVEEEDNRMLKISDNGIGIDLKKNGDKLFGMYRTFNGNADARGIGLFITRNQIEAMGGSISVSSLPGKGTTFTITFR